MSSAAALLNTARSQLGYASSSTRSKFNDWYGMPGYWCAMFVSWAAAHSGNSAIIPRAAYTPSAAQWFRARGQWHWGGRGMRPGDIVFFCFGGRRIDHVGIFEGWGAGYAVTIEGNTGAVGGRSGGRVMRRRRSIRWIVGYGRPAYGSAAAPAPASIAVDGYIGPESTRALQRIMQTPQDGYVSGQNRANAKYLYRWTTLRWGTGGSQVVTALQRYLGTGADGYLGPNTVKALQHHLSVNADGYLGPDTAKAFQRWINSKI